MTTAARDPMPTVVFDDLPTAAERAAIVIESLRAYGQWSEGTAASFGQLSQVVDATEGFSGAEIAALVPEALFEAFGDGREISAADLVFAARCCK